MCGGQSWPQAAFQAAIVRYNRTMPMKNPPHPGDLIRTEVIEALGLNVSKAAEILKVRRATLSDLLHGKAALTPEMALRIQKPSARTWTIFSVCNSPMTWRRRASMRRISRSSGMSRPDGGRFTWSDVCDSDAYFL